MAKKAAEDARMAKLYREVVLKEKPVEAGFVPRGHAGRHQAGGEGRGGGCGRSAREAREEVGSFGD